MKRCYDTLHSFAEVRSIRSFFLFLDSSMTMTQVEHLSYHLLVIGKGDLFGHRLSKRNNPQKGYEPLTAEKKN